MRDPIYEKPGVEIIRDLGLRFRSYRKRMGLTQKEVSVQSGLSIFTISSFENGSMTGLTIASFIRLLRAIEMLEEVEQILPPLPPKLKDAYERQQKRK